MRRTFAQVLREGKIDPIIEYTKLYALFYNKPRRNGKSVAEIISHNFLDYYFRGTCLTLEEFDRTHGICFEEQPKAFDVDYLVNFAEYIHNFVSYLESECFYGTINKFDLLDHIERVMGSIGYIATREDGFVIFVPKDNGAIAVAESELIPEKMSYRVISYNHHSMKGDLEEKRQTLLALADLLEPKRLELNQIDNKFTSDLFYAFNNFNIRHNNVDPTGPKYKKPVAELSQEELEHWYDEVYQMCLLAFMRLDHADRKAEFDVLKGKIENKE